MLLRKNTKRHIRACCLYDHADAHTFDAYGYELAAVFRK